MTMTSTILTVHNLSKTYHGHSALERVSLSVNSGDIYGLMGRNGAGKTTLIRTICGLTLPDKGAVSLFDRSDVKGISEGLSRTGVMIEESSFYPYLTARQNLEFYRKAQGIPGKECIDEVLALVGLDTDKKKFKNFSLGMKQRLGLALALLNHPDLLILDEPTNGLDPVGIVEMRNLLLKLNAERHVSIFISSHILSELAQLATRYGFLHHGRLVHEISADALSERCREYLELTVDRPEAASTALETMLDTHAYDVLPDGRIRIYGLFDATPRLSQMLSSQGIGIYSMTPKGQSLEDYFLTVIGGDNYDA